jgi:hypothetical protein
MTLSHQHRAYLFAMLTVLMWSTVATAFKYTLTYVSVVQMLTIACCSASLMLLLVVVVSGKTTLVLTSLQQHWKLSLIAGLMNPCFYYLVLFEAYDRLPAQLAQPINMTWAIVLVVMAAVVLKQRISRHDYVAAGICYLGVLLIISQGGRQGFSQVDWAGIGLALLSTLIWAGYWVLNIRDERDPVVGMFLNFLIATPLVLTLWAFTATGPVPLPGILGGVYIGVFEMSLAFLCWSIALKSTDNAATITNLVFLAPFLSLQLIQWVLGEAVLFTTYGGLVVIIAGLVYQQRTASRLQARISG